MTKVNFLFEKVLDYVNEGYEKQALMTTISDSYEYFQIREDDFLML